MTVPTKPQENSWTPANLWQKGQYGPHSYSLCKHHRWHRYAIHLSFNFVLIFQDAEAYLNDLVLPLVQRLQSGQRVLVHCSGGKGRTSMKCAVCPVVSWVIGHERPVGVAVGEVF